MAMIGSENKFGLFGRLKLVKKEIVLVILVVIFSLLITLYAQFFLLKNRYSALDDHGQCIIWMAHLRDGSLFNNDFHLRFENWKVPWGLKFFYYLSGRFWEPLAVVKVLPFFLGAIAALYSYWWGCLLKNRTVGLMMSFLVTLSAWYRESSLAYSDIWFGEGGPGSFHPVLLIMFIFYLTKKDYFKTALVMVAQALVYPPALLIAALTYVISSIKYSGNILSVDKTGKRWYYFWIVVFVAVCCIAPKYFNPTTRFGSLVTREQMKAMPEFYSEGRTPFFYDRFYQNLTNYRSGLGLDKSKICLLFVAGILSIMLGRYSLSLRKETWSLLCSGVLLFFLAHAFLLELFEPERYVRYVLPLFLIAFIAVNIERCVKRFVLGAIYRFSVYVFLFILGFFIYFPHLQNPQSFAQEEKYDTELYDFVSTTPRDAVLAAAPLIMDKLTIFCLRKGLVVQESAYPYLTTYYKEVAQRTRDFFEAYYADNKIVLSNLCARYGIGYFVIYKGHFTSEYFEEARYYYSPFNEFIKKIIAGNPYRRFAVFDLPQAGIVFQNEKYLVFDCRYFGDND